MSKEALEKLSIKQVAIELFNIVSNGKYDMNDLAPYFDRIDKSLTELEELKRDVKRYFELQYKSQFERMTQNEIHDMYELREKLLKVGNK